MPCTLRFRFHQRVFFKAVVSKITPRLHPWGFCVCGVFIALNTQSLVVLQYHQVRDDGPKSTSVSVERFEQHLELIESLNLTVMDLVTAVQRIQQGESLEQSVALTFDDGYNNLYENAFPKLKERQWPFTVFISTDPIDKGYGDMLNWDQIRELAKHKGRILNHTRDHAYLARPPFSLEPQFLDNMMANIKHAQRRINQELSTTSPQILAYPYGEYNEDILRKLQQENWIAFGQHSGPIGLTSNWQALPRFPASGLYSNPKTLKTKLQSLAFQVLSESPVTSEPKKGVYRLDVATDFMNIHSLQCFFAGSPIDFQKQVETDQLSIVVSLPKPMPKGRSRINCTAQHLEKNAYFWHSKPWLNLKDPLHKAEKFTKSQIPDKATTKNFK